MRTIIVGFRNGVSDMGLQSDLRYLRIVSFSLKIDRCLDP